MLPIHPARIMMIVDLPGGNRGGGFAIFGGANDVNLIPCDGHYFAIESLDNGLWKIYWLWCPKNFTVVSCCRRAKNFKKLTPKRSWGVIETIGNGIFDTCIHGR